MARRASLTAERIAAKVGADADVPETSLNSPSIATEKFRLRVHQMSVYKSTRVIEV